MLRTLTVALVLSALAATPAQTAGAAQSTQRTATCKRSHSRTVAQNDLVRVFTRRGAEGGNDGTRLLGCWKRTGRTLELAFAFDDDYVTSATFGLVRLRGRFAAFYSTSTDISCKAACPPDYQPTHRLLNVADVRSRTTSRIEVAEPPAGGRLLLSRSGAIAWPRWLAGNQVEVRVVDAGGERAVDSGAIHPESLRLTAAGQLGWVRDGLPHALQLAPPGA